ncbi:MAG: Eco57I restriction-modification methylase domain-containing protein [Lachnospiraceae bacterium]|nr:Eco57I restriction-modification methylase domain-containing protein [Lachnospiraceae bacterium]
MKFDFIIGNPPYQEEQASENAEGSLKNYAPPIYDKFMDEAYKVSDKVELIHPARFLFNAGSTPKSWNEKMLNDEHFKVLHYEEDGHKVFPSLSTPLRGGVAITYRDSSKVFGAIQAFTKYPEVNDILHKVIYDSSFKTLMDIVYSRTSYRLTEVMHADHPEARYKEDKNGMNIGLLSKGHDYDMSSNIMGIIPDIFHDKKPNDGRDYIQILGRANNRRIYKYIRRDYVKDVDNLDYYKVYVAQANGSGEFGETISEPVVEGPGVGSTETFLSIGKFENEQEAYAVEKYIKTKFARALLSVLKVTQNGNKPVWRMIPLQDFTTGSDIGWSQSISDIDHQLYAKYGLSDEEIQFIETHVKEMK